LGSDATAIVTHAGKNNQEYIDHAVMLGVSLKRHMPDYPRIALGVRGMSETYQDILEQAGWHVVLVADWSFSDDGNNHGCQSAKACTDDKFILQQRDSMERLNIFRLPIGRVLYLDADTYVESGELNTLLNGTGANLVPEGNIGMVQNACNRQHSAGVTAPYSAGVMLFKPSLEKYKVMLSKVAEVMNGNATRKNDEQIINEVYETQLTAMDRKYNCMDPWDVQGADKCQKRCTEVVVSHFFGGPKPAMADKTLLSFVRKPSGPFEKCSAMNHGSCSAWSKFYCDLVDNKNLLTVPLQQNIRRLGGCCHTPAQENDPDDCHSVEEACAETVSFNNVYKINRSVNMEKTLPWFGNYSKTTTVLLGKRAITPDPFYHGGRPMYAGPNGYYLFYGLETRNWLVGRNIKMARARNGGEMVGSWLPEAYAFDYHMHTRCPELTKSWKFPKPEFKYLQNLKESTVIVTDPNAAEAHGFESLAMYKKHMKYKFLELKHKRAKKRRMAKMEEDNTTADDMITQDSITTDETISEDKTTADEAVSEDNTAADETAPEDKATTKETAPEEAEAKQAVEATSKEEAEAKAKEEAAAKAKEEAEHQAWVELRAKKKAAREAKKRAAEKEAGAEAPQATTADEAHTEDTTTGEVPKAELGAKMSVAAAAGETTPQAAEAAPEQGLTDIRKKLEDAISALPDIPEVAAARKEMQEKLGEVIARI